MFQATVDLESRIVSLRDESDEDQVSSPFMATSTQRRNVRT